MGPGSRPERARAKETEKSQKTVAQRRLIINAGADLGDIWGSGRGPEIDQNRARDRKSGSGEGAGGDFRRFFSPSRFGVGLGTDFWRVRPWKTTLPPQREHDFHKITVFEKTPKKEAPETRFGTKNGRKSTSADPKIAKIGKKKCFWTVRFFTVF